MSAPSDTGGGATSRQGPGRPRDPEVDTAILRAARDVFIERGVDATSIEGVARRAGVTRLTVYRRYRDKQELLLHTLTWGRGEPLPELDAEQLTLDTVAELLAETLARPQTRELLIRLAGSAADHPELIRAFWDTFIHPRRAELAVVLVRMQASGRLDEQADPDTILDMVAGAFLYHLLLRPDQQSHDELLVHIRATLQHAGLRPGA